MTLFKSFLTLICMLTVQHIDEVLTPAPLIEKDTENHAIFTVPIIVIPGKHVYSKYAGVTVSVCKRFQFVITSVNNLKMSRHKIVNQSENGYG